MTEQERWRRSWAYASRQGCDAAAACEYADHVAELVAAGSAVLPCPHAPLYERWLQANGGTG